MLAICRPLPTASDIFHTLQFMNRMVRAYMHEEELRARHQATLLRLREDALQEKTQAHLEWLKIKKKALQKKGDDDKMPPLARMERGLRKKYKQEQVSKLECHACKMCGKLFCRVEIWCKFYGLLRII